MSHFDEFAYRQKMEAWEPCLALRVVVLASPLLFLIGHLLFT